MLENITVRDLTADEQYTVEAYQVTIARLQAEIKAICSSTLSRALTDAERDSLQNTAIKILSDAEDIDWERAWLEVATYDDATLLQFSDDYDDDDDED